MRAWWMVAAAAGLVLAGCKSDGERSETAPATPRQGQERAMVQPPSAEEGTARVLAATRTIAQNEVDAAKLAEQRASSTGVKDYAVRSVAESQAALDSINDLVKAKKIDLDSAALQADPLLKAEKQAGKEAIDRLRGLKGTAFDATYLTAERPVQGLLSVLAQQGVAASRDNDVSNALRAIAQQAHDRVGKATSILPSTCGGDASGWGGAG